MVAYHDDNNADNAGALHTNASKKTPVREHMVRYTCMAEALFYLSFQREGTFPINGEIEAFDVDTHLRLLERDNIIKILTGNNANYERVRQRPFVLLQLREKYD